MSAQTEEVDDDASCNVLTTFTTVRRTAVESNLSQYAANGQQLQICFTEKSTVYIQPTEISFDSANMPIQSATCDRQLTCIEYTNIDSGRSTLLFH